MRVWDASSGEQVSHEELPRTTAGLDALRAPAPGGLQPGDLVLFPGRDALHRVTPTIGEVTRLLVVFAFNDKPGVQLSDSALATFYGRHG